MSKAIKKIKVEAKKEQSTYVSVIADFLLDHIKTYPEYSKYILREDKSIVGSLDYVKNIAEKQQKNGVAVMATQDVFPLVLKYFRLKELPKPAPVPRPAPVPQKKPTPKLTAKEAAYGDASLLNLVEKEEKEEKEVAE